MRSFSVALIIVALPVLCQSPARSEDTVVAYTKNLDVAKLDPKLASQRLEDWLKIGPSKVDEVQWRINDCDLKSNADEPKDKQLLCVRFGFRRGRVGGWGIVTVGTVRKGVDGPARFEYAQVASPPPNASGRTTTTLSEIPMLLNELQRAKH